MTNESTKRNNCRLCLSKNLELALKLTPTPVADAYIKASKIKQNQSIFPLDLMLCKNCGNSQIRDVVSPDILYRDYLYESVSSLGFIKHFQDYAKETVSQIKPQKHSLVIDIGSNDGTLLKAFISFDLKVLGIDPAKRIARQATSQGIETLPEYLSLKLAKKIKKKYGQAQIVTTNNVFANVDNLDEFTNSIKEMLSPSGVFIFETFYMPDTIKNMVFDFIEHEHLSYFSVYPLSKFFKKFHMEIIDVKKVDTKGGSIRVTVQLKNGHRRKLSSVNKFISQERKIGIHTPKAFKKFQKSINKAKNELLETIRKLKKHGKSIAGYGASAQSTTLIYHFNLTDKLEYIVDDYKRKHNTLSPGCHIKVYPSKAIYEKKPDAIIIIAWRYAKPIIAKNQKYLKDGGIFLTPLPKLKIVGKIS